MNSIMKKVLVIASVACVAVAAGGWQSGKSAGDEDAIKARCAAFGAAWNQNDATAMAALWSADGDLINPWGRVAKGRAAVEALFKDEHSAMMKGSRFEQRVTGVRVLEGGVAVVDWDVNLINTKAADGATQPPMPHHVAVIMQKDKSGTWMIEAARPYVFAAGPKPEAKSPEAKSKSDVGTPKGSG